MSENRERLAKLLELTRSNSDGEALTAMRMANAMLKAANKSWSDILLPQKQPTPPPRPEPEWDNFERHVRGHGGNAGNIHTGRAEVIAMFNRAKATAVYPYQLEFIRNLMTWWDDKAYLTKAQFDGLKRIAEGRR
jgi:hypothetical protein